jgi:hypothetical protein
MSRTWNTAPYRVQERRLCRLGRNRWRFVGYPATIGGAQEGRKEWSKRFERTLRARVRNDLAYDREPPPRILRRVKWELW